MADGYSAVWFDPPPPEIPVVETNPALKRLGNNVTKAFSNMESENLTRIDPLDIDIETIKTKLKTWRGNTPLGIEIKDSIKINAQYLLDMLNMIRDCEIYVNLDKCWSPVYFKNQRAKGLIMPLVSAERMKSYTDPLADAEPVVVPDIIN